MSNLVHPVFGDRYFSDLDGYEESLHVFVRGNRLKERSAGLSTLRVAETGFGTGLNLLAAITSLAEEPAWTGTLRWSSVEKYPLDAAQVGEALGSFAPLAELLPVYLDAYRDLDWSRSGRLAASWGFRGMRVELELWHGDVLEMLAALAGRDAAERPDAWVLDGHSPALNPDMWSDAVFEGMARASRMEPSSSFASFTAAGAVKRGLRAAGFLVRRQPGFGAKRHMISGAFAGCPGERSGAGSPIPR